MKTLRPPLGSSGKIWKGPISPVYKLPKYPKRYLNLNISPYLDLPNIANVVKYSRKYFAPFHFQGQFMERNTGLSFLNSILLKFCVL